MNAMIESLTGMNTMTDQVIATDFLIAAKSAVKTYAIALTETATAEVRTVLRKHLDDAISTHEQISNYMINKGWYDPFNISQQIQMDLQNADTALSI